jgi:hypothetical protein
MKKRWFVTAFGVGLLFLVGLLWWRVRELERIVDSLKKQQASNSTVVWQNEQQSNKNAEKKQVFKLIDSPHVDPGRSKVGVPWDVERAMMGGADHSEFESQWNVQVTPGSVVLPDQPDSK